MKLKEHRAFLVNFVIDFVNGDMSREDFDMDYSGYVIEHFPEFEREHPRLSRRFADTVDRTYSTCVNSRSIATCVRRFSHTGPGF